MGWFTKKKKGETTEEELQEVQHQFLYLPFVPFIIGFQFHLQAG